MYMEDPESKTSLVNETPSTSSALTVCSVVFRLKRSTLAMRELTKCVAAVLAVQMIMSMALTFMRPPLPNIPLGRWFVILAICPKCILYGFMYLNLVTGPWGSKESRFWCDVRIMYARGFNTIRSVLDMFSTAALFMYLSILMGHSDALTLSLLILLGDIAEWQSGLAEHLNQHDVKAYDRFVDGDVLCLETLHYYQQQHVYEPIRWTPYIISTIVKLYTITCVLCAAATDAPMIFQVPIAVSIVIYVCIAPCTMHFVYFKGMITFTQLELYRSLFDVACPLLILTFSMV